MKTGHAIVIGAGIVGASSAYELARQGWTVTLLDQGEVGGACSKGNCGYVCPSHVFPLARPGAIAATLPLVFRRNSPFAIRPRFDLRLLAWFNAFRAAATPAQVEATMPALHDLLWLGKSCYEETIRDEAIACDYSPAGCLFISRDRDHLAHFEDDNKRMQDRFNYGARRIDPDELTALEPCLRPGLGGAWLFECDAHLRPDRYMAGLRAALLRRGVTIAEHCAARGLAGAGRSARTLTTTSGTLHADLFVLAAGAWTPLLASMIGARLPIVPGKGYSVTLRDFPGQPTRSMVFEQHRVAVTPFAGAVRVGSTMEFAGYDDSLRPERLQLLTDGASAYLRTPIPPTAQGAWWGWRPMVPDGKPFIDRAPRWDNVIVAAGHSMIGMSTGPGTGRLVAQLASGEPTAIDLRPFAIGR